LPAPLPAGAAGGRAHRLREGLRSPAAFKNALVLLLTGAAGYVDAISYLALGRVFTANMTGNTVLLGLALVQGDTDGAGRALLALAGFLVGGALGAALAYRGLDDNEWPRGVTLALVVEGVVLVALANDRSGSLAYRVTLAAIAMGIQSAAARRLDVFGITTTFVTGTLTMLISLIVRHGVLPSATGHGKRLLGAVWVIYVVGAMAAGAASQLVPGVALQVPAAIVAVVAVGALVRFWRL
jgi:uncharacterized membrane protein YoaK (UPF0700 family)